MMQAMTTKARRAPGGCRPAQSPCFLFGAKGESTGKSIKERQPFRCNKTKTSRTEVTVEPRTASPPEPLAGEDYFCQDNLC